MPLMNAENALKPENPDYSRAMAIYIMEAYLQDLSGGDITTRSFLKQRKKPVTAQITANSAGVLAGVQEAEWFLGQLGIGIISRKKDGTLLQLGDTVMEITAPAEKILAAERTLLNLLQRMSGVATAAKKMAVKMPPSIKLLSTRKTLWGLLDKRAAMLGGAGTHRLNLNDAILIKDNHIALSSDFKKSLKSAFKKAKKARFIEVELENAEQIESFLEIFKKLKVSPAILQKIVVMLDNFKPAEIKKIIPLFQELYIRVELSGGITASNIRRYCISGVSFISSGQITSGAGTLDMSLSLK